MTAPSHVGAALWYAEGGLAVFPLRPGTKVPLRGSRGLLDASQDPDRIRAWWTRWPSANVAVATGGLVDVIDVDPAGVTAWARQDDWPEPIGVVCTPRPGGAHLYVPAAGLPNTTGMAPGVDYRGRGGYVVAPPSRLTDRPHPYHWRRPLDLGRLTR